MNGRNGGSSVERQLWTPRPWRAAVALVLVLALLPVGMVPSAWSQTRDEDNTGTTGAQYGLGVSSVLVTIPYGLVKIVMATLGAVFGGFTYAFSGGNEKAALAVWDTSLRGTYVITPDHLKGNRAVRFFGVPPGNQEAGAGSTVTEPGR